MATFPFGVIAIAIGLDMYCPFFRMCGSMCLRIACGTTVRSARSALASKRRAHFKLHKSCRYRYTAQGGRHRLGVALPKTPSVGSRAVGEKREAVLPDTSMPSCQQRVAGLDRRSLPIGSTGRTLHEPIAHCHPHAAIGLTMNE